LKINPSGDEFRAAFARGAHGVTEAEIDAVCEVARAHGSARCARAQPGAVKCA